MIIRYLTVALAAMGFCMIAGAEEVKFLSEADHKELLSSYQKQLAKQKAAPLDEPKIVQKKKRDIIAESTILTNNGEWTIVPKGAVIYMPEHLTQHIVAVPQGNLLQWGDFLQKNRRWLKTQELSRSQANGKEPLSDALREQMVIQRVVVVAVMARRPTATKLDLTEFNK